MNSDHQLDQDASLHAFAKKSMEAGASRVLKKGQGCTKKYDKFIYMAI